MNCRSGAATCPTGLLCCAECGEIALTMNSTSHECSSSSILTALDKPFMPSNVSWGRKIVSADSFAGMLRHASDSSGVFVLVGLANATPILTLGVLAFFFDKRLMLVGDLFIMGGIICAVSWGMLFCA